MGVPAFFSWLIKRYPLCLQSIEKGQGPIIDNLYLDMNGILYKCARDEATVFKDLIQKKNFVELYTNIFNYINQIINLVAPRKLIFLSFDGPAPRAKMNQQRSRRFGSAKSFKQLNEALYVFGKQPEIEIFKNNSISAGTEFMHELNQQMKFFIMKKFDEDDHWKQLSIIYSGSDVAGEGEHKIINFIRQKTQDKDFDPNSTHCIYGADADLIMLGLSTHIKYINIVREEMPFTRLKVSYAAKRTPTKLNFQIIYLNIVREYMDLEYSMIKENMKYKEQYNIDKIIDDFIFICFFIGNDFLPRCYGFNIREGNFEQLIQQYKEFLIQGNQYVNNSGELNFKALEVLMGFICKFEKPFIEDRLQENQQQIQKNQSYNHGNYRRRGREEEDSDDSQDSLDQFAIESEGNQKVNNQENESDNHLLPEYLKQDVIYQENKFLERLCKNYKDSEKEGRLFYYKEKLGFDIQNNISQLAEIDKMLQYYVQGLQFVLYYYYQSIPSWSWYYPYYYSPMTSDLYQYLKYHNEQNDLNKIQFNLDEPFPPLKQLLCILHPDNADLLPNPLKQLLINKDSPLRQPIDYYPEAFQQDAYGAIWEHEYISILPFINDQLINQVYNSLDLNQLKQLEKDRNILMDHTLITYNKKFKEISVQSTLPNCFPDFSIHCQQEQFKIKLPPQINYNLPQPQGISKFPSLHIKKIKHFELSEISKMKKANQLTLVLENENQLDEANQLNPNINFYWNYPNSVACEVTGWIDRNKITVIKKPIPLILDEMLYKNNQKYEDTFYDIFQEMKLEYKRHGITLNKVDRIVFIRLYSQLRRTSDGQLFNNTKIYTEHFVPDEMIMADKAFRVQPYFDMKQFKGVEEEFPIDSKIIVFDQDQSHNGNFIGLVQSYKESKLCKEIMVKIKKKPWTMKENQSKYYTSDKNLYYNILFVSKKLNMDTQLILDLLDSISVEVDKNSKSGSKLPDQLDIGLNVIQRQFNKIVPILVRVPLAEEEVQGRDRYQQFEKYLELSETMVQLIQNYYSKYPQLFDAITKKQQSNQQYNKKNKGDHQKRPRHKIILKPKDIFPNSEDPNIDVIQIYIWIMQQPTSQLLLNQISSKSMTKERIETLQTLSKSLDEKLEKHQQKINKIIQVNPNFACRQNFYNFIPMFFTDHPYYHEIGDRVINLNCSTIDSIPFGLFGTIVGVSNGQVDVLFDKEFIGGQSLGGRCQVLRGAVVQFADVFNLECWGQFLMQRDMNTKRWGWDQEVQEYKPRFHLQAIKDDWEYNQFIEKFNKEDQFQQHNKFKQPQQQQHHSQLQSLQHYEAKQQDQQQQQTRFQPKKIKQSVACSVMNLEENNDKDQQQLNEVFKFRTQILEANKKEQQLQSQQQDQAIVNTEQQFQKLTIGQEESKEAPMNSSNTQQEEFKSTESNQCQVKDVLNQPQILLQLITNPDRKEALMNDPILGDQIKDLQQQGILK